MASLKPKPMPSMPAPATGLKRASLAPKNMGGKLPAAIGKPKTDHGKMKLFSKGGKVCK